MSYDVEFANKKGKVVIIDRPLSIRDGKYGLDVNPEAWLNITYNYSDHFYKLWKDGIRSLYGKTAAEVIKEIDTALPKLKDDVSSNYWDPTEGNVKEALKNLKKIASLCPPDSILRGD